MAKSTGELTLVENLTPTDEILIFDGEHTRRAPSTALTGVLNAGNLKMPDSDETIAEHYRQFCNRNLLINGYFGRPVNQRGKDEYSGNGDTYGVDMWRTSAQIKQLVKNGFMRIERVSISGNPSFYQRIEDYNLFIGKTVTLSLIYRTGVSSEKVLKFGLAYGTGQSLHALPLSNDWSLVSGTFTIPNGISSLDVRLVQFWSTNAEIGDYIDILAAKFELGPNQTLAHKEGSVWVPNEIPDYATELAKCQRYFYNFIGANSAPGEIIGFGYVDGNAGKTIRAFVPLPVPMRANPTVISENMLITTPASRAAAIKSMNRYWNSQSNGITLDIETVEAQQLNTYAFLRLNGYSNSVFQISAEL